MRHSLLHRHCLLITWTCKDVLATSSPDKTLLIILWHIKGVEDIKVMTHINAETILVSYGALIEGSSVKIPNLKCQNC